MTLPVVLWEMESVPVPSVSPGTGTLFCIGINETWRKFLLGAMEGLLLDVFEGDQTAKTTGYNYARELIGIIQQAEECQTGGGGTMSVPIGGVVDFGGEYPPGGWLWCDGRAISRTAYSELFSIIGTTYGSGDGSTTFNIPNLQDRVRMGAGSDPNGYTGGQASVTLTESQMPSHQHIIAKASGTGSTTTRAATGSATGTTAQSTGYTGDGQPHENRPPFLVMYPIMRVQ